MKRLVNRLVRDKYPDQHPRDNLRTLEPEERVPGFCHEAIQQAHDYVVDEDLSHLQDIWQLVIELGKAEIGFEEVLLMNPTDPRYAPLQPNQRSGLAGELVMALSRYRSTLELAQLQTAKWLLFELTATYRGYSPATFRADMELRAKHEGGYSEGLFLIETISGLTVK